MNIANLNQSVGFMPVNQSTQDSHEQNIQKQIVSLQEKMRNITYNNEMSSEEKNDEKKALQEQIQSLNSELKQYQMRKRREETEKRQEEAARKQQEEATKTEEAASASNTGEVFEEETVPFPEPDASKSILTNANTKEHLSNLQRIRNDLEGKLRTAESEEEKAGLRKRISNVSKGMGVKVQKIKDTIADGQSDVQTQKNKNGRLPQESKEQPPVQGKVLLTRKKV